MPTPRRWNGSGGQKDDCPRGPVPVDNVVAPRDVTGGDAAHRDPLVGVHANQRGSWAWEAQRACDLFRDRRGSKAVVGARRRS